MTYESLAHPSADTLPPCAPAVKPTPTSRGGKPTLAGRPYHHVIASVALSRRVGTAKLALFAHLPSDRAKLGSFRPFHSRLGHTSDADRPCPLVPVPPTFGFVSHNCLRQPPAAGEIGFVSHVSLPGRATPCMLTAFAYLPQSPQVWLCFAHIPSGRAKLGSFRTIRARRPRPSAPISGRAGRIGFVLHNRSAHARAGGRQGKRPAASPSPIRSPQSAIEWPPAPLASHLTLQT
jgi:hypothetical protein